MCERSLLLQQMSGVCLNQCGGNGLQGKFSGTVRVLAGEHLEGRGLGRQSVNGGKIQQGQANENSNALLRGCDGEMSRGVVEEDKASIGTSCDSSFLGINLCGKQSGKQNLDPQRTRSKQFDCPSCRQTGNKQCPICHGHLKLRTQSGLIKFFEYILEYKLGGKAQSVADCDQGDCGSVSVKTNSFSRKKDRRRTEQTTLAERKNECENVHYGYFCNSCDDMQPIVGSRFTCGTCLDFDLCRGCYLSRGHCHPMTELVQSACYRSNVNYLQRMIGEQDKIRKTVSSPVGRRIGVWQNRLAKSCRG